MIPSRFVNFIGCIRWLLQNKTNLEVTKNVGIIDMLGQTLQKVWQKAKASQPSPSMFRYLQTWRHTLPLLAANSNQTNFQQPLASKYSLHNQVYHSKYPALSNRSFLHTTTRRLHSRALAKWFESVWTPSFRILHPQRMASSERHKTVPICNEPRPHCHTGSRPSWQGKGSQHLSQSNGLLMKLQGVLGLSQNSTHVANRWDSLNESVNFQVQALQPMASKLCIPNCGCSTKKYLSLTIYHTIFLN